MSEPDGRYLVCSLAFISGGFSGGKGNVRAPDSFCAAAANIIPRSRLCGSVTWVLTGFQAKSHGITFWNPTPRLCITSKPSVEQTPVEFELIPYASPFSVANDGPKFFVLTDKVSLTILYVQCTLSLLEGCAFQEGHQHRTEDWQTQRPREQTGRLHQGSTRRGGTHPGHLREPGYLCYVLPEPPCT